VRVVIQRVSEARVSVADKTVGQIGAGITTAPIECFNGALAALGENVQGILNEKGGAS